MAMPILFVKYYSHALKLLYRCVVWTSPLKAPFFFTVLGFASLHKCCSSYLYTPNNESFHEEVQLILLRTHFWQCLEKKEQVHKMKIFKLTDVEHLAQPKVLT